MHYKIEDLKKDLVSIIIPAYNCEKYISDTLESILNQSYITWEAIVIDDCSTDSTYKIVNRYANKDTRIKCYKLEKNSGAAIARNTAIEKANGRYIAFLDSDDIWFSEKLSIQLAYMKQNNYTFTCTNYLKINEYGKSNKTVVKARKTSNYNDILKQSPGNSTVIYDSKKLGKFFIPNIKKRNDYVMWLKVIKKAKILHGLNQILTYYRIRNGSLSNQKWDLLKYHWKVYRKIEGLSFVRSLYLSLYWVIIKVFRIRK